MSRVYQTSEFPGVETLTNHINELSQTQRKFRVESIVWDDDEFILFYSHKPKSQPVLYDDEWGYPEEVENAYKEVKGIATRYKNYYSWN